MSAESEEEGTVSDSSEEETEQEEMETEDEESEEVGIDYLTKNLDVEEPALPKVDTDFNYCLIVLPHILNHPFWS